MGVLNKFMWEIYVPVSYIDKKGKGFDWPVDHHQKWDAKVRDISGGLTIFKPVKGQWIHPLGHLQTEEVIPVRIACSKKQFRMIINMTLDHYNQKEVLGFKFGEAISKKRGK